MTDPIRIALDRLHEYALGHPNHDTDEIVAAVRAALAQSAPPAEGEVGELVEWLRRRGHSHPCTDEARLFLHTALLLAQRHPAPVPVSERLPKPEDCDGEGRCWWWNPPTYLAGTGWWGFEPYEWIEDATHWLPAHALPLPTGKVK